MLITMLPRARYRLVQRLFGLDENTSTAYKSYGERSYQERSQEPLSFHVFHTDHSFLQVLRCCAHLLAFYTFERAASFLSSSSRRLLREDGSRGTCCPY